MLRAIAATAALYSVLLGSLPFPDMGPSQRVRRTSFKGLITPDGAARLHFIANEFSAGTLTPDVGPVFTTNGTVPTGAGYIQYSETLGAFTDANYFSIAAGSNPSSAAGAFTTCVYFYGPADRATAQVIVSNGQFGASGGGWIIALNDSSGSGRVDLEFFAPGSVGNSVSASNSYVSGVWNIFCGGRDGSAQGFAVLNGGTAATLASAKNAASTAYPFRVGRYEGTGAPFQDALAEVYITGTAPTASSLAALEAPFIGYLPGVASTSYVFTGANIDGQSNVTLATGDSLASWYASGTSTAATQTGVTKYQPSYRPGAVVLDGVYSNLVLAGSQTGLAWLNQRPVFDIVALYRNPSPLYHQIIIGQTTEATEKGLRFWTDTSRRFNFEINRGDGTGVVAFTSTATEATGACTMLEVQGDGYFARLSTDLSTWAESYAYTKPGISGGPPMDAVIGALTSTPRPPQQTHTNDGVMQGDLYDLRIIPRVLTSAERAALRADYLARCSAATVITAIGDSVTEVGYDTNPYGWPVQLQNLLGTGYLVSNQGSGFDQSGDMLTRWTASVRAAVATQPGKRLIVGGGYNDIIQGTLAATAWSNLQTILDQALADGDSVVVETIGPMNGFGSYDSTWETKRTTINGNITAYASAHSLPVLDKATILAKSGDATSINPAYDGGDHLHPNKLGNAAIAAAAKIALGL
jgi:lysophospholipase L1-like esterase